MYIKHMRLICSSRKKVIPRAAFLDIGPMRIYGTSKALYYRLYQYQWPLDSGHQKLFRQYQSIQAVDEQELRSPCSSCSMKVKCLVVSYTDHNYEWPSGYCQYIDKKVRTLPDRIFHDKKITSEKIHFVLKHKCNSCVLMRCCYNYSLILRMLCPNYIQKLTLYEKAEKRINETWGSIDRFMAALTLGWKEVYWKPPEAKRERKYRIAFIHPNQDIELIQDYYPYRLRIGPVQAEMFGLRIPEEKSTAFTEEDVMTAWVLWKLVREHLQEVKSSRYPNLGRFQICGHYNFLLSVYVDTDGHPVLETATSKWKYNVTFDGFDDIGFKLAWRPPTVLQYFQ